MKQRFLQIIENFKDKAVLVIGDVMLDKFVYGKVRRISPEAPIPVVRVTKETYMPGGAGNTANNLASLKAFVHLIGVVGDDKEANILKECLNERGINHYLIPQEKTIQKTRLIGEKQQIVRIDYENIKKIEKGNEELILKKIKELIDNIQVIIISDYAKGCITKELALEVIRMANEKNKKVIVDPKSYHKEYYKNAFLITPNDKESFEMTQEIEIEARAKRLCEELNSNVLITLGEKGMALFENNTLKEFPAVAREVYDVSGAGDTVVATIALALSANASLEEATQLANHAAGIVVGKTGTAPIKREELLVNFKEKNKIRTREELKEISEEARSKGKKIVTTNGVFDLMHYGHIDILKKAKKLGDILVVGINTDASVKRIKGDSRPILGEQERASIIAALDCVDYVCLFSEDTPNSLLETIKPDIHVKGSDRKMEEIGEKETVEKNGGKVVLLPIIEGISTTRIINKILKGEKDGEKGK